MKRKKPCRHTRCIKTRKGKRFVVVNKGIPKKVKRSKSVGVPKKLVLSLGNSIDVSDYGFDPKKSVVHGTNISNAEKMRFDKKLVKGTFVHPGRGGFEDASNWAGNSFNDEGVIVLAETDKELDRGFLNLGWITLGDRRKEREGLDVTKYDELGVNKIKLFKRDKSNPYRLVEL